VRFYKLKRETTADSFSFYNAQLNVGEFSDPAGNRIKGFGIISPRFLAELPIAVPKGDAIYLANALNAVTPQHPILSYTMRVGRLARFCITINSYISNWMGQDGYKGSFFYGFVVFGNWTPTKVTASTLKELAACLLRFYQ
jgi:hypothetical protein